MVYSQNIQRADFHPDHLPFLDPSAIDYLHLEQEPMGYILEILHSDKTREQVDPKVLSKVAEERFPGCKLQKAALAADILHDQALQRQCYRLFRYVNQIRMTTDIPLGHLDLMPSYEDYERLQNCLQQVYEQMTPADLVQTQPTEGLEYEHWIAVIRTIEKWLENSKGNFRIDTENTKRREMGMVFSGISFDMATAIGIAVEQYSLKDEAQMVNLDLGQCGLTNEHLARLGRAIETGGVARLNLLLNGITLDHPKVVESLKKALQEGMIIDLRGNKPVQKILDELRAVINGHDYSRVYC